MPKNPAYTPSLNLVKGEPDKKKIKPTTIDRAKYQKILDGRMDVGDNLYSTDKNSFVPEILGAQGFGYHSGTINGKDAVYKKGNNYYMYNEKPDNGGQMGYALMNIGDLSEPKIQPSQDSIAPKQMPIDPMKVEGFNGIQNTRIEQFNKGGDVKKLAKYYKKGGDVKGYVNGTNGSGVQYMNADDPTMDTHVTGYQAALDKANADNVAKQQAALDKQNRNNQIKSGTNTAGRALGMYGTGYYAANPGDNSSEQARSATLATVSQAGPVGGAIGGLAAIGDKIGKPIKASSEQFDENGNLIHKGKAENNAVIGGIFSGTKALATRQEMNKAGYNGNKLFGAKKEYSSYLEGEEKKRIQAQRDAEIAATRGDISLINGMKVDESLAAREAGDVGFDSSLVTPQQKQYSDLGINTPQPITGQQFKDNNKTRKWWGGFGKAKGGVVKGAGTGTSDSINAKVEEGTFIVPAKNAHIAETIRKNILKKPAKEEMTLNQGGGVRVRLSDGEHAFSPEEKFELKAKGLNLEALAPDAEDNMEGLAKGGETSGDINSKYESLRAKTEADLKKDFPNSDVKVIYKGDTRNAAEQLKNYKSGASTSKVSLHQIGGARDFNIIVDGRILGNSPKDLNIYKKYLWKNAEDNGLFNLKAGKDDFGDVDPYHIGLVEEKGDGTAFKRLVETYPEIKNTKAAKETLSELSKIKEKNPKDTTYDVVLDAFKETDKSSNSANSDIPKSFGERVRLDMAAKNNKVKPSIESVKQYVPNDFPPIDYGLNKGQMTQAEFDAASAEADAQMNANAAKNTSTKKTIKAKPSVEAMPASSFDPTSYNTDVEYPTNAVTAGGSPVAPKYGEQATAPQQVTLSSDLPTTTPPAATTTDGTGKKGMDWGNALGTALNYGIPAFQVGLGLSQLKKAGERPKDKLSPEYLASISQASANAEQARQNAKYGYTAEELAMINMKNQGLTNSERYNARNLAGGSSATALNLERSAVNDSFGRDLMTKVQDKNLMLQKQQIANDRQQYKDALITDRQNRLRQYFGDQMSGWQQNQQAGYQLVGAGLQNIVGASRYEQEKAAAESRDKLAQNWTNGLW